ncbi:hypothetical protein ACFZB9_04455 [Kitasatospora sp. NPDC008050]|uniref:hypothetical protein n=1 Tax=Kitasatospora sp. NPDC008050 TaxID=3364021 RepID=UPI0036E2C53C
MHVQRTAHARFFTVLPNGMLQDRQLSYTARGLLADLLSRADGWREDGRQMADTSPQGRAAIRRALKELTAAGFYRVEKVRLPDGTIRSEAYVFDTPQLPGRPAAQPAQPAAPPSVTRPDPGAAAPAPPVVPPVKEPAKANPLPPTPTDQHTRSAVALLFRVLAPEPRLRLGEAEAAELAPLVSTWLERRATAADLAQALLPCLPVPLHSAKGLLRDRLQRKMPPEPGAAPPAPVPRLAECPCCHDPVRSPGICRACAGLDTAPGSSPPTATATTATVGAAVAREAVQAAKSMLAGLGRAAPAGSPG